MEEPLKVLIIEDSENDAALIEMKSRRSSECVIRPLLRASRALPAREGPRASARGS